MKNYGMSVFNAFLLALAVYAGLLFFIFFKSDNTHSVKYTDIKDSFIDVEFGEYKKPEVQPQSKIEPKKDEEGQETTNKMVKTEEEPQKTTDISDLFGDTKEFQQEKTNKVQSSAKSIPDASKPKQTVPNKELKDNLMPTNQRVGESVQKQQTGIYDKFLGAIRRKLQENWTLYERSGNFTAKLEYVVESNGYFRYTSVTKTGNEDFDAKVIDFLSTLQGKYIAVPPKNKAYKGTANLSDEITMMGD